MREIREELATIIKVGDLIEMVEYDYPDFHLSMDCFWCEVIEGQWVLLEAQEARWLTKDDLTDLIHTLSIDRNTPKDKIKELAETVKEIGKLVDEVTAVISKVALLILGLMTIIQILRGG